MSAWYAPEGVLVSNDEVQALAGLDELGLDDEARELFLNSNARRVFGLNA